jgi:hypothetical protein
MTPSFRRNPGLPLKRTEKGESDHEVTDPALREWLKSRAMPSAVLPPSGLSRVSPSQAKPAATIARKA